MAVTLRDIAEKTQLTPSAISKILNPKQGTNSPFSPETCKRVFEVAKNLGYRPSFSARSLVNGRTYSIGFQCGNIRSAYYGELAEIAMRVAEERGYHLTIQVTPWQTTQNDLDCLETLLRRGMDGVIFFGSALGPGCSLYEDMVNRKFPIVTVNTRTPDLSWVASDHRPGMLETVAYLKRKGHLQITYLDMNGERISSKRGAFLEACRQERVEGLFFETASIEKKDSRQAGHRFAEKNERSRAVIAMSDQVAIGFMCGLFEAGLEVPRDVAVVGIDGTEAGEYFRPKLTTIAQDREGLMKQAVEKVIYMIENKGQPVENVSLPTKLIVRESA